MIGWVAAAKRAPVACPCGVCVCVCVCVWQVGGGKVADGGARFGGTGS